MRAYGIAWCYEWIDVATSIPRIVRGDLYSGWRRTRFEESRVSDFFLLAIIISHLKRDINTSSFHVLCRPRRGEHPGNTTFVPS